MEDIFSIAIHDSEYVLAPKNPKNPMSCPWGRDREEGRMLAWFSMLDSPKAITLPATVTPVEPSRGP